LERRLGDSSGQHTMTWQVVITHFPPYWAGGREWACLAARYGLDLHISGHVHYQYLYGPFDGGNALRGTSVLVSGGGGGITSEKAADVYGNDDQYGFMHLELAPDVFTIHAITHTGVTRKTVQQRPRNPNLNMAKCVSGQIEFQVVSTASTTPPPIPAHVSPTPRRRLQGHLDENHKCLGENGTRSDANYEKKEAPTLEECEQACLAMDGCTGIEFGPNSTCKAWTSPIKDTSAEAGITCIPADHLHLDYSHLVMGGEGGVVHV